jgi:hypothetical protein
VGSVLGVELLTLLLTPLPALTAPRCFFFFLDTDGTSFT